MNYADLYNWTNDLPPNTKNIFLSVLDKVKEIPNPYILEIGTFAGTSILEMLKYIPNSKATVIDPWNNYEESEFMSNIKENNVEQIFHENIKNSGIDSSRIRIKKGFSQDILIDLLVNKEKFDFIYVDGSHKCLDCYLDCVLSLSLLKKSGILGIDDVTWNFSDNNILNRPYDGVLHFYENNKEKFDIISTGYRLFVQKKSL